MRTALLIAVAVFALSGCEQQQPGNLGPNPVIVAADFDSVFSAVETTLRDNRFVIFRADPRMGQIRTRPLTGAQPWEVWRHDSVGTYNQLEAGIHTILRTVEARIYPVRDDQDRPIAGQHFLEIRALTERLNMPENEITIVDQVPEAYGGPTVGPINDPALAAARPSDTPVFLSRDSLLEDYLIRGVMKKLGQGN